MLLITLHYVSPVSLEFAFHDLNVTVKCLSLHLCGELLTQPKSGCRVIISIPLSASNEICGAHAWKYRRPGDIIGYDAHCSDECN